MSELPPISPTPPAANLPGAMRLPPGVSVVPGAISLSASRSSGPGGQNVNKVNTRMELRLPLPAVTGLTPTAFARLRTILGKRMNSLGEIRLVCQISRSQEMNKQGCLDALADLIQQAWDVPAIRHRTRPTRGSERRRIESKKRRSETKSQRRGTGE